MNVKTSRVKHQDCVNVRLTAARSMQSSYVFHKSKQQFYIDLINLQ
jgi:hypothetical protein